MQIKINYIFFIHLFQLKEIFAKKKMTTAINWDQTEKTF